MKIEDINKVGVILVVLCLCIKTNVQSQTIHFDYGTKVYKSKILQGNPEYIHGDIDNRDIWLIGLGVSPFFDKRHEITAGFHTYRLLAEMGVGNSEDIIHPNQSIRIGNGSTRSYAYSLGYKFRMPFYRDKLFFNISANLIVEHSVRTWPDGYDTTFFQDEYRLDVYRKSNPGIQLVPQLSAELNYRIYKGFGVKLEYSHLFGNRPNMILEGDYYINDVFQERAISYTDTSGFNLMLGLTYDFIWKKRVSK